MIRYEKKDIKIIFYLLGITLIVYFISIFCDFSFIDDPVYTYKNPFVTEFNIVKIFSQSYFAAYIPVTLLTYCVDYLFWGNNPAGYHITSLLFHLLNCAFLYLILMRLTKNRTVSFFTTILFAIHPVQVQTVVWISERKSLVSFFFMLFSINYYMDYKETKKTGFYIFSFLFFVLSVLAKPISVTLFLFLMGYDIFILQERTKNTILDKTPFIAVSLIISYVTIEAQSVMGAVKNYYGGSLFSNIITIPKAILHYFKIILFPKDLVFYYNIEPAQSMFSPGVIFGIIIIAFLVFVIIKNRIKNGVISLGSATFFIFLLPVSNIVPLEIIAADRYLYLPIIGLGICFFSFFDAKIKNYKRTFYTTAIFVMILFSYVTVSESFHWMEKEGIWENILEKYPKNLRAMNNLIELYMNKGDNEKAFELIKKALLVDDRNASILKSYALYKKITGNSKDEVIELFDRALTIDPYDKEIYLEMAKVYYEKKEYDKALDIINKGKKTIYQFPLDTEIKYKYILANIYVKKIMFNEAINEFRMLLEHSKDYPDVIMKYALLKENFYDFDGYKNLYITSGGSSEYKEKLEKIFERLNLKEEGETYLLELEKRFK